MFGSLFKRRKTSQHELRPDDVRRLAGHFLDEWPPYRDRYGQASEIAVEWVNDRDGNGIWTASVIPAIDTRVVVLVDDDAGQVTEARVIAMRQNAIVAQWHRGANGPASAQDDR